MHREWICNPMMLQRDKNVISPSVRNFHVALKCWIDSDSSGITLESSQKRNFAERSQAILEPYLVGAFPQAIGPILRTPAVDSPREPLEMNEQHFPCDCTVQEALTNKTTVVELVVDKWFVDMAFGCGKAPTGEIVFTGASRKGPCSARGVYRARRTLGKNAWKEERDEEKAN